MSLHLTGDSFTFYNNLVRLVCRITYNFCNFSGLSNFFISHILFTTDFPLLWLFCFDKSLFGLSNFLSLFGVAVLSCNDVEFFLGHDCSSRCMVKEGGGKSEAFSVAKTENLCNVVKSLALLLGKLF